MNGDTHRPSRQMPIDQSSPIELWGAGESLGCSDWLLISQEMITDFGNATRDPDPMHMDPEWARSHGPYDTTIAFGFLTISLLTYFLRDAISRTPGASIHPQAHYLNYGFDRIRLVEPVPEGSRIRGRFIVTEIRENAGRQLARLGCTIEIEGNARPALVAEWLVMCLKSPAIRTDEANQAELN